MNTLAESCAVPPPAEDLRGPRPTWRTSVEPPGRFAQVAALTGNSEQVTPDNTTADTTTGAVAGAAPAAPGAPRRVSRSAGNSSPVVLTVPSLDPLGGASVHVGPKAAQAKPAAAAKDGPDTVEAASRLSLGALVSGVNDFTPISNSVAHSHVARHGGPVLDHSPAASSRPTVPEGTPLHGGPAPRHTTPLGQGTQDAQAKYLVAAEPAGQVVDRAAREPGTKPGALVSKLVAVDAGPQAAQKSSQPGHVSDVAGSPTKPQDTGQPGQPGRGGQVSENLLPVEGARDAAATSGGAPAELGAGDSPRGAAARADRASPETPVARRDLRIETAEKPKRVLHAHDPARLVPKGDVVPVDPTASARGPEGDGRQTQTAPLAGGTGLSGDPSPVSAAGAGVPLTALSSQIRAPGQTSAAPNVPHSVGEQILDSVRTSVAQGDRLVSLRLHPPELGMVTIRLREQGGHLEGTFEVSKSDTRHQIEQALPDVVRSLQEAGVPVRRFEVTDSASAGPDLGRGAWQQEGWAGHNGAGQGRDHLPPSYLSGGQEPASYAVAAEETGPMSAPPGMPSGRLDMLL